MGQCKVEIVSSETRNASCSDDFVGLLGFVSSGTMPSADTGVEPSLDSN